MTISYLEMLSQEVHGKNVLRQVLMTAPDKEVILRALAQESMDAFRKRFTRAESEEIPLKTFEIVGGVMVDLKNGGGIDSPRFFDMFLYLIKSGFPIRPDFTVSVSQFLDDVDYLRTNTQADVTLISNVPLAPDNLRDHGYDAIDLANPSLAFLRAKDEFARAKETGKHPKSLVILASEVNRTVSDLNTVENWRDRLALSQSKLIFSIFSGLEVDLAEVMPPNYRSLGAIDKYDPFRDSTRVNDVQPLSGVNWQVIGSEEYIEMALYVARTDINMDTGQLIRDDKKRGTQLGTHIVEVVQKMFEEEGTREMERFRAQAKKDAAQRPAPAPKDKPKPDDSKP